MNKSRILFLLRTRPVVSSELDVESRAIEQKIRSTDLETGVVMAFAATLELVTH